MKRREFLKTGIIGGGLGIAGIQTGCATATGARRGLASDGPPITGQKIYMRHELSSPEAAVHMQTYAKAISIMKAQPSVRLEGTKKVGNGLNWARQAEIHLNSCPHSTWKFFPWHRDYLSRFEAIIRAVTNTPDFTLPYWDWSNSPSLPRPFQDTKSSFYLNEQSRKRDLSKNIARVTNLTLIAGLMKTTDFESFMGSGDASGQVEFGPHNGVHVAVGETMGTFRSPLDPIFWLHHCNVDRLWAEWQEKNPQWLSAKNTEDKFPAWLTDSLDGFYETDGSAVKTSKRSADVIDTYAMGYCYNTTVRQVARGDNHDGPVAESTFGMRASRGRLKTVLITPEKVQKKITPLNSQNSLFEVILPTFQNQSAQALNEFLANPNDKLNFEYRLRVSNFPRLGGRIIMKIYFDPKRTRNLDQAIFLNQYAFFNSSKADQEFAQQLSAELGEAPKRHHHMTANIPPFNMDYKNLLQKLYELRYERHPDVTSFLVEFVNAADMQPSPMNQIDFSKLDLQLTIQQRSQN